jgi:hypothetical protein
MIYIADSVVVKRLDREFVVDIGISWEGGMKTSTYPPMRPYEGDQMQDYE